MANPDSDPVYDEACRIVGQCCLMLAQNGDEISRAQVAYQLKCIHRQIMEGKGESNLLIKMTIKTVRGGIVSIKIPA